METKDLISIQLISSHYNVPVSFINALYEYELIELISVQETVCVYKTEIRKIEKMMRLHFDLNINAEGLDVIYNLLNQVENLQKDIIQLNNKLNRFEDY